MKIWFITGASRGFGRIWAEAALTRGDKVAATARTRADVADLTERFGDTVLPLALDVTDAEAVRQVVAQAHAHFGKLGGRDRLFTTPKIGEELRQRFDVIDVPPSLWTVNNFGSTYSFSIVSVKSLVANVALSRASRRQPTMYRL